jgi:tetratricopeptide (TPR) repeat protein
MAQFPYRVLLVLFAAYAGSEIEHKIISIRGKAVLAICVIFLLPISYGVYRQVDIRKKMDSEYHLFSHMNDAVFIQDYYDLYPYGQDSPDYLFQFAKLLQSQGRYTDSNAILRQGTLLSCDPMFYVLMGNNYVHMEFYQEAENAYMEAHCRMPNRLYPLYQLMLLYSQIGDEEKAESMAIRLLNKKEKITSPATIEMKDRAKALLNKYLDE